MGFFSNLISGAGRLVRGFLGIPAVAPAVAAQAARVPAGRAAVSLGRGVRSRLGAVAVGAGAGALGVAALGDGIEPIGAVDGVGGNGRTFRQTVIITRDSMTGEVVRQEVRRGSPFLMRSDIITANRVFRVASKLHGKLPRRTVKESRVKALTTRVVESALDRAACPTSQHNGG